MANEQSVARWYDAYPKVKSQRLEPISRSDLLDLIHSGALPGRDFLLVDLRRDDHRGGTIQGSLNLPAQTLYPSLPTIYTLAKTAKISKVIWYCGSSKGRGSRAAGWFRDLLEEKRDDTITSLVLSEGIAGWAGDGAEYRDLMDEYDSSVWHKG